MKFWWTCLCDFAKPHACGKLNTAEGLAVAAVAAHQRHEKQHGDVQAAHGLDPALRRFVNEDRYDISQHDPLVHNDAPYAGDYGGLYGMPRMPYRNAGRRRDYNTQENRGKMKKVDRTMGRTTTEAQPGGRHPWGQGSRLGVRFSP